MTKYYCECLYCGNRWTTLFPINTMKCAHCTDTHIKKEKVDPIDYYTDKPIIKEKISESEKD